LFKSVVVIKKIRTFAARI